ncbi:formate dehydrogenase subunit delta [Paracoccus halophilus]|uniref:Formate dehydrogenase n=1 Tax=Paracoccus halophilus TaxID=376733 RepID=A0A099F387_9RHOB|nr:formate dehydrogenase subunit delta [Paracoccus halophilus]KGJ04743.1 formate dehydrogenase [Paracoccus halophilus]SFA50963.1 formate dehydrogenase subunit delta [Paracoccus halophilus]
MSDNSDKLIRMAGQMADFFRSQPDRPAPEAVAEHINDSWTYRMRRDLIERIEAGAEADPIVRAAVAHIELPPKA